MKPNILSSSFSQYFCFLLYAVVMIASGNEDRETLLKIKSAISNNPHGALSSWNNSLHYCNWTGVTCEKRHRRVISLQLMSQGHEGFLSPYVGNLSFLQDLCLSNNSLRGSIPQDIGRLSMLHLLDLSRNKFEGVVPANLSACSNLQVLILSRNGLVGLIPKDVSFLSKLVVVNLGYNNLTGEIPPILGNITSIEKISFSNNPLGGIIPDMIGHWKNLREFNCSYCNLHGTIPHALYNLSLLNNITLSHNNLTGRIPGAIGTMLPHLVGLRLWQNQLSGPLPPSISNFSRLEYLDMGDNKFSGMLTIDFAKLPYIYYVRLSNNLFGSSKVDYGDDMKFIDSLVNCSKLRDLRLHGCQFQGVLPTSIGNLSNQLKKLYLFENQLHGNLLTSIGNLVGLEHLRLNGNKFTGNIPSTIGNLKNIQVVQIFKNQLSGQIPETIGNLSLLSRLDLSSNMLEGVIPSSIGNCHNLLELNLNDNKLNGKIPTQLLRLPSLSIALNLSQNKLFGSLPPEVGDLNKLATLDLSCNNLSGNIPSNLGSCGSLEKLSLRGNYFKGTLPTSLSSLKALTNLDISHNNFSGKIPRFLEQLNVLQYLNLSYNDFEGELPIQGVFANASAFSVLNNTRLCGGFAEPMLPKCKETQKNTKKLPLLVIIIVIASTLFTIICLAYVWCEKKSKSPPFELSSERFMNVTYKQLLKATNGFSEANLIGNGGFSSVYKGTLDKDDGTFVAVKVLHLQNQGAQKSFMRECEIWRNIRHRNLLKIITSCSGVDFQGNDFKALIYEFMLNGSLHDWLHSSKNILRLNLLQIINILLDVAHALDYIHNSCVPPIVHGDLKPSNILLDDEMVAHVGDFGFARFVETSYHTSSSTGIRGTIGYTAPEYGVGSMMRSSGDVYSYGILLLEVMTGKMPNDGIFEEGLSLHKFASMALPNHAMDVIDVNILNVYQEDKISMQNNEAYTKKVEECLTSIIKIGVVCSVESPTLRMDMKTVVHELQHIALTLQNN